MRYFESILKILSLAGAIYFVATMSVLTQYFMWYLVLALILGIVLIFNRSASYHFKQAKKDLVMRRIEGVLLILFSYSMYVIITNVK